MRDFNKVIILGNLTRDPEVKVIPSGQSVATFGIATNRRWNDSEGNSQEETEFHEVVAWGKLAEIVEKILQKGKKALVEGRLKTRNWEGQDGVKRYKTEIIADNVLALSPKEGGYDSDSYQAEPKEESSKDVDQDISDKKTDSKSTASKSTAKKDDEKASKDKADDGEDLDKILDDFPF